MRISFILEDGYCVHYVPISLRDANDNDKIKESIFSRDPTLDKQKVTCEIPSVKFVVFFSVEKKLKF